MHWMCDAMRFRNSTRPETVLEKIRPKRLEPWDEVNDSQCAFWSLAFQNIARI